MKKIILLVMVICLAGCGSMKTFKCELGAFKIERDSLVENRVYTSSTSVLGLEAQIDEATGTPYGRGGLITHERIIDTTGNQHPRQIISERHYEVPWLFKIIMKKTIKPLDK